MPANRRILAAYEYGLRKLADELIAENDPSDEERAHLLVVSHMAQALVKAYDSYQVKQVSALGASATAGHAVLMREERPILNVSLRTLVDNNLMTPWHARFLGSNLALKRSVIVTGEENVGKSTLLNAIIDLLPRDERVVAVDESEEGLPALQERPFTVQLKAKLGTPARAGAFRRAAQMMPSWIVVGELARREGPLFLETLTSDCPGLATVQTPEPEAAFADWLSASRTAADDLNRVNPLVFHLRRDQRGRPRLQKVLDVTVQEGSLVVRPCNPIADQGRGDGAPTA